MKVLVTGSRVYGNYEKVKEAIIQAKEVTFVFHSIDYDFIDDTITFALQ